MLNALQRMNETPTRTWAGTNLTQIRSLSDLRSYLHSYRIRNPGNLRRTSRASIIIAAIDVNIPSTMARRAARELAALDPDTFHWLPAWKPRLLAAEVVA